MAVVAVVAEAAAASAAEEEEAVKEAVAGRMPIGAATAAAWSGWSAAAVASVTSTATVTGANSSALRVTHASSATAMAQRRIVVVHRRRHD